MYRTRRALKSLQYSQNGFDIAGVPSAPLKPLKNRTGIKNAEEKENPKTKQAKAHAVLLLVNQASLFIRIIFLSLYLKNTDAGIQCIIRDEELLTSEDVSNEYWTVMVCKRKHALAQARSENQALHALIDQLHDSNEMLRSGNTGLLELVDEVSSLKVRCCFC
jgi:hypothetical protein